MRISLESSIRFCFTCLSAPTITLTHSLSDMSSMIRFLCVSIVVNISLRDSLFICSRASALPRSFLRVTHIVSTTFCGYWSFPAMSRHPSLIAQTLEFGSNSRGGGVAFIRGYYIPTSISAIADLKA